MSPRRVRAQASDSRRKARARLVLGAALFAAGFVEHARAAQAVDRDPGLASAPTSTTRARSARVPIGTVPSPVPLAPDWRATADLAYGRFFFGANVLPDERVLVTGGCSTGLCSGDLTLPVCSLVLRHAEALSRSVHSWMHAGDDVEPRFMHASVSLQDGSVLVAGGCTSSGCATVSPTVRRYDPVAAVFRRVPDLLEARAGIASVRLSDGRVLLAGGCTTRACSNLVEVFDPATGHIDTGARLNEARGRAEVVALADGRILVTGGCSDLRCTDVLASAEVYDPDLDRWSRTAPMTERRAGHHATLLLEGRVLVGGGCPDAQCSMFSRSTELFEPATMRFLPGPDMQQARLGARAMRLPDGTVMINQGCSGRAECDLTNERFDPISRTISMMDPAFTPRAFHELVMHTAARQVISIAGCTPGHVGWWVESFDLSGIPDANTADATVDAARDAAPDVPARDVASDEPGMPDAPPADAAGATDTGNVSRRAPACGCRIAGADPQRAFARSAWQWLAINLCMLGMCRSKRRRPSAKAPS